MKIQLILELAFLFLFLCFGNAVAFIDPVTWGAAAVAGLYGYQYFDQVKMATWCKKYECCMPELIPHAFENLYILLNSKLFGQHIIIEKLHNLLASHYKSIEHSQKPLVMSFHGTPGTGKNYVANMIAEAVLEKGTKSKFYHVIHGSQYSSEYSLERYKEEIKNIIFEGIDSCSYSIFVFDEVDKMPSGIFNSITSMLDHHTLVKGRDFRRAVFIFLTNYGGDAITKLMHSLTKVKGIFRHELKLVHFEEIARIETYNKEGGMRGSQLIKSAVIDFYFPFLPLEESHIVECIKAEFRTFCKREPTKEVIDEILEYISFSESTGYAYTGCKTIHPKVKAEC